MSRKAAIRSSIRHWNELATAPVGDLISENDPGFTVRECALCVRCNVDCTQCPLFVALGNFKCYCAGELYNRAVILIKGLRGDELNRTKLGRDRDIKRFRRVAEKMIRVLESCLERAND